MKPKIVKIDFIHHTIKFIQLTKNFTESKAREKFGLCKNDDDDEESTLGSCVTEFYKNKGYVTFIFYRTPVRINVILHEIVHAVDHIYEIYGLEGKECRAYLTEYIYSTIVSYYRR